MDGGEAQLRTMQEKGQEEKHEKQTLLQSAHVTKLPRQHDNHNAVKQLVSYRPLPRTKSEHRRFVHVFNRA